MGVSKSYNCQVNGFPQLVSKNDTSIVTDQNGFQLESLKAIDVGSDVPYGKCSLNSSITDERL